MKIQLFKKLFLAGFLGLGITCAQTFAAVNAWQSLVGSSISGGGLIFQVATDSKNNLYSVNGNNFLLGQGRLQQLPANETMWQMVDYNGAPYNPTPYTIAIDKGDNIFVGNYNGVWEFASGKWQQLGQTLYAPPAVVTVDSSGLLYVAGSLYGSSTPESGYIYKIVPGKDTNWQPVGAGDGTSPDKSPVGAMYVDKKDNLYIGTQKGNVYQLPSGGSQWIWMGSKSINSGLVSITTLVVNDNSDIFAGSRISPYMYKLSNGGTQWQQIAIPSGSGVGALVLDMKNNIYCGTGLNYTQSEPGIDGYVYEMPAGSNSWLSLTDQATPDGGAITSLTVDSNNNLYASTWNHVYLVSANPTYSTDPGAKSNYNFDFYYGDGVTDIEFSSVGLKEDSTGGSNIINLANTKTTKTQYTVSITAGANGSSGTANDFNFKFGSSTGQESHMLQIMPYDVQSPSSAPIARFLSFFIQGKLTINKIDVADDFTFGHNGTSDHNWWIATQSGKLINYNALELSGIDSNGQKQYFCLYINNDNFSVLAKAGNCVWH